MQHRWVLKRDPGPRSWAFCIINDRGQFIYASADIIPTSTNLYVEAKAIEKGIDYCVNQNLLPLIVETDSLTMKRIIEAERRVPWSISMEVKRVQEWRNKEDISFRHIMREGNQVTYFLANTVFFFAGSIQYHHFADLPIGAKKLLNIDKQQISILRFQKTKGTNS